MNSSHLGDVFDHWKGSLISLLVSKQLLGSLVVEPMITDPEAWPEEDIQTYKRLLGLEALGPAAIFHATSTFHGANREDYFNELPKDGDIFLDPDIGFEPKRGGNEHIKVAEIINLLKPDRLVMVYQHSDHSKFGQRFDKIINKLEAEAKAHFTAKTKVHCAAYNCGQVVMFFISLNRNRIDKIKAVLQEYLRGTAQGRVL